MAADASQIAIVGAACDNGIDDDGDGRTDALDRHCSSPFDTREDRGKDKPRSGKDRK
jgi:hypothetical protein